MNPEKLREDFPIFQEREELVYLDSAATSQKPEQVINALQSFYSKNNANVGRGLYELAGDANKKFRESRKKVADFINARTDEIVFVNNTTEAVNLLAHSLELEGNIVVSEIAHHSEQLPWRRKAEEENLELEYIPTENGEFDMDAAEEIIDEETALVTISHVSNVTGSEHPLEEIVELAHRNDALVMVDGAQSVPRMKTDVKELDADFLVFSGHKMLGPTGIGVLYGKKDLLESMEPYKVGGGMIRSVKKDEVKYEEVPEKFEAGTPNVAGAVGLSAAIEHLENVGMKKIEKHDRKLCRKMKEGLSGIEGVKVLAPEEDTYVVSFTTDFAHPHDVAEILNQNSVAVRAGHHCTQPLMESLDISGTTRASPYLYNTEKDVEKLVEAVKEVKRTFS
ncbi:MAG: cysteine desulfurase [Nanohaloarchaea archaeon]|nr:cysteine desulfurase [Candidatus Nanohaloarchaea archaeon]